MNPSQSKTISNNKLRVNFLGKSDVILKLNSKKTLHPGVINLTQSEALELCQVLWDIYASE